MNPLVSIICPVFNRLAATREGIQSALAQTYTNLELIIIDDGSEPPIHSQLECSDPRIRWIRKENNSGPGASREIGRQHVRGDYIQYLDSDDYLHPEKIARQVAWMQAQPAAGMCYCTSLVFDELPLKPNLPVCSLSDQTFDCILPVILRQRPWSTSACLWRKTATDAIGPWAYLYTGEDIEYEVRAGCLEIPITHLPEPLCYFRRSNTVPRLTDEGAQHMRKTTAYKLSVASHLQNTSWADHPEVRGRVWLMLVNLGIFYIAQKERPQVRICLQAARGYSSGCAKRIVDLIGLAAMALPASFALALSRRLRRLAVNSLSFSVEQQN